MTLRKLTPMFLEQLAHRCARDNKPQRSHMLRLHRIVRNWIVGGHPIKRGKVIEVFSHGIGDVSLDDISPRVIENFADSVMRMGRAPRTATSICHVVSALLNFAVQEGYAEANFAKGVKVEGGTARTRRSPPSQKLIAAMLGAATEEQHLAIGLVVLTGLFSNEQRKLRWQNVDPERGRIQLGRGDCHRSRSIPFSPILKRELNSWRSKSRFSGPTDVVFCNEHGRPFSSSRFMRKFIAPAYFKAMQDWPENENKPPKPCWADLRCFALSEWWAARLDHCAAMKLAGLRLAWSEEMQFIKFFPYDPERYRPLLESIGNRLLGNVYDESLGQCERTACSHEGDVPVVELSTTAVEIDSKGNA